MSHKMEKMYKKHIRSTIALPIAIVFGITSGCNGSRQANHFLFNSFKKKKNAFGFEKDEDFTYKKIVPPKPPRTINWNGLPSDDPGKNSIVMETRATIPATIKGIWVLGSDEDSTSCLLVVERQQVASMTSKAHNPDNRVGFLFSIPKRKLIPAFWTMLDQTIQVAEHYKPGTSCNCFQIRLQDERLGVEVTGSLVDALIKQTRKLDYREVLSDAQELTGWTHFDTSTRIDSFERKNTPCGKGVELNGFLGTNDLKKEDRLSLILAKERDPFAFVQSVRKGLFQSTNCVTHVQGHVICPVSNKRKNGFISVNVDKKELDGILLKEYPVTYGCVQKDTYRVTPKGLRKATQVSLFELKPTAKKRKAVNRSVPAMFPYKEQEHIYDMPYANNSGIPYEFNHKLF
ncbi:MAG TPA: hypothetical protein VK133_01445 [Amoebophilaceae bacterium]|nr:hypothetical protein [Amoebophilaceae bacterium]